MEKFLDKYNIVGLAIGTAIALSVTDFVNKTFKSILMPILGTIVNIDSFQQYKFSINGNDIYIGEFISAIIELSFILLMLWLAVKYIFKRI